MVDGTLISKMIELHFENSEGEVKVVLPSRHIMVLPVEAAVKACGAHNSQIIFQQQFDMLLEYLAEWIKKQENQLKSAYLTMRDSSILFLVVQNDKGYNKSLDKSLTDLDLAVANDDDYNLIKLDVQSLPLVSEESVQSFLSAGNTLRYNLNG